VDKQLHNSHQGVTYEDINRISTMTDKRIFDEVFHRMLFAASTDLQLADTESGFFPPTGTGDDANLLVKIGAGGDRDSGVGMKITTGLGFRKMSAGEQPDDDLPLFVPMFGAAEKTFTTDNSDGSEGRIDHVYMKPAETPGNSQTVKIIDPVTENITDESRDTNQAYDYDYAYVAGTPDTPPSLGAPSAPGGYTESDKIAEILILPGSGALDPGDVTDTRELFEIDDQLVPGVTALDADVIVVDPQVEGQSNAQDALEALEDGVAAASASGLLVGRLEYVSTGVVKIAPGIGDLVKVDIGGTVLSQNTDLVFTLDGDADLDTGIEASSRAYYLYVYDLASTIGVKISETPPDDIGDANPGYHPTETPVWRCVGSFWNDDQGTGNIVPFIMAGDRHLFKEHSADQENDLLTTAQTSWNVETISIPRTMPAMFGTVFVEDGGGYITIYGCSDASGTLPNSATAWNQWFVDSDMDGAMYVTKNTGESWLPIEIPIANRAAPAIGVGVLQSSGLNYHMMVVRGYVDPWAPRT